MIALHSHNRLLDGLSNPGDRQTGYTIRPKKCFVGAGTSTALRSCRRAWLVRSVGRHEEALRVRLRRRPAAGAAAPTRRDASGGAGAARTRSVPLLRGMHPTGRKGPLLDPGRQLSSASTARSACSTLSAVAATTRRSTASPKGTGKHQATSTGCRSRVSQSRSSGIRGTATWRRIRHAGAHRAALRSSRDRHDQKIARARGSVHRPRRRQRRRLLPSLAARPRPCNSRISPRATRCSFRCVPGKRAASVRRQRSLSEATFAERVQPSSP